MPPFLLLAVVGVSAYLLFGRKPKSGSGVDRSDDPEGDGGKAEMYFTQPMQDQGPTDQGPADQGPADQGPADQGPADQGPADQGPADQGPADQGPADQGPADQGPIQHGKFVRTAMNAQVQNALANLDAPMMQPDSHVTKQHPTHTTEAHIVNRGQKSKVRAAFIPASHNRRAKVRFTK